VTDRPIETAGRLLADAVSKFKSLPAIGKAVVIAIPVLAFAAVDFGGEGEAAAGLSSRAVPAQQASDNSFFRTPNGIIGVDLDREMESIANTWLMLEENTGPMDLDEAIEFLQEKVETDASGRDLLEEVRDSENGDNANALMADAMALLSVGETWGAVANLLVAWEIAQDNDEDEASPLLSLAGLANSQGLPHVALALLEAAKEAEVNAVDAPAGISKQAAWLNNQGHALLLLGEYEDAEAVLQQALELSPEMSEAARNLVYVLLKQDREDEARALMPRVAFRLPGPPAASVPVKPEKPEQPDPSTPKDEPPPDEVKPEVWVKNPFLLEDESGYVRLPLSISLDLTRKGQIAWPEIIIPEPGQDYPATLDLASKRYMAAKDKFEQIQAIEGGLYQAAAGRRFTWSDRVQQAIEVRAAGVWTFHPVDTEMQVLNAGYESLIVSGDQPTRFAALDVARADHLMAQAADRLYERYRTESQCAAGDSQEACCSKQRAANDRNIEEFTPIAKEYIDRSRVLFRESYGWASAYASNLPEGHWYSIAKLETEKGVWNTRRFTQMNVYMDFLHAAPLTAGRCYQPFEKVPDQPLDLESDLPSCEAAFGKKSAKLTLGKNYSISVGCGKVKFSVKAPVSKGKLTVAGADVGGELGLQGEIEFNIKGTVTIFGGPYVSASAKVGDRGVGADVKDGVYMVIGRDGIQDAGFRVAVGSSGSASGALGGSEPIMETMDFSVVSAI